MAIVVLGAAAAYPQRVPGSHDAHDINVIGAFALLMADALDDTAEHTSRMAGASSAALVALAQVKEGRTIKSLAMSLRVSHSRAVRVADALESVGMTRRVPSAQDGRVVRVRLTRKGAAAAAKVQKARAGVLERALGELAEAEVVELSRLVSKVLQANTTGRRHAHSICRLCDAVACGHDIGRCPVTAGADAQESSPS